MAEHFADIVIIKRNGEEQGRFPIIKEMCTFGRDISNDIRLHLPAVSKRHSDITIDEQGNAWLENLSDNGTQLNGVWLSSKQKLKDGDIIEICARQFRFRIPSKKETPKSAKVPFGNRSNDLNLPPEKSSNFTLETPKKKILTPKSIMSSGKRAAALTSELHAAPGSTVSKSPGMDSQPGSFTPRSSRRVSWFERAAEYATTLLSPTKGWNIVEALRSPAPPKQDHTYRDPPVSPLAKIKTPLTSKKVTFGPLLSPEVYETDKPPTTPVRRGRKPPESPALARNFNLNVASTGSPQTDDQYNKIYVKNVETVTTTTTVVTKEVSDEPNDLGVDEGEEDAALSTTAEQDTGSIIDQDTPESDQEIRSIRDDAEFWMQDTEMNDELEEAQEDSEGQCEDLNEPLDFDNEEHDEEESVNLQPSVTLKSLSTPLRKDIVTLAQKFQEVRPESISQPGRKFLNTPFKKELKVIANKIQVSRPSAALPSGMKTPMKKEIVAKAHAMEPIIKAVHQPKKVLQTPMRNEIAIKAEEIQRGIKAHELKKGLATPMKSELVTKAKEATELRASQQTNHRLKTPVRKELIKQAEEMQLNRVSVTEFFRRMDTPMRKEIERRSVMLKDHRVAEPLFKSKNGDSQPQESENAGDIEQNVTVYNLPPNLDAIIPLPDLTSPEAQQREVELARRIESLLGTVQANIDGRRQSDISGFLSLSSNKAAVSLPMTSPTKSKDRRRTIAIGGTGPVRVLKTSVFEQDIATIDESDKQMKIEIHQDDLIQQNDNEIDHKTDQQEDIEIPMYTPKIRHTGRKSELPILHAHSPSNHRRRTISSIPITNLGGWPRRITIAEAMEQELLENSFVAENTVSAPNPPAEEIPAGLEIQLPLSDSNTDMKNNDSAFFGNNDKDMDALQPKKSQNPRGRRAKIALIEHTEIEPNTVTEAPPKPAKRSRKPKVNVDDDPIGQSNETNSQAIEEIVSSRTVGKGKQNKVKERLEVDEEVSIVQPLQKSVRKGGKLKQVEEPALEPSTIQNDTIEAPVPKSSKKTTKNSKKNDPTSISHATEEIITENIKPTRRGTRGKINKEAATIELPNEESEALKLPMEDLKPKRYRKRKEAAINTEVDPILNESVEESIPSRKSRRSKSTTTKSEIVDNSSSNQVVQAPQTTKKMSTRRNPRKLAEAKEDVEVDITPITEGKDIRSSQKSSVRGKKITTKSVDEVAIESTLSVGKEPKKPTKKGPRRTVGDPRSDIIPGVVDEEDLPFVENLQKTVKVRKVQKVEKAAEGLIEESIIRKRKSRKADEEKEFEAEEPTKRSRTSSNAKSTAAVPTPGPVIEPVVKGRKRKVIVEPDLEESIPIVEKKRNTRKRT